MRSRERVVFESETMSMDLRYLISCGELDCPLVRLEVDEKGEGLKGPGVCAEFDLKETQEITFVFREIPSSEKAHKQDKDTVRDEKLKLATDPPLTKSLLDALYRQTSSFWLDWISLSTYKGRYREHVLRSALTLKLLTYEPVRLAH
jgi:hypothetical protein